MIAISLALAIISFTAYGGAMRYVFVKPRSASSKASLLTITGVVCAAIQVCALATTHPKPVRFLAGSGLYLAGMALFIWSIDAVRGHTFAFAYSRAEPHIILTSGPYQWFRHPFYLAYSLTWIAGALTSANIFAVAAGFVMIAFYTGAARQEEQTFLCGPFRSHYLAYRHRVGLFGPKLESDSCKGGQHKRDNIKKTSLGA